MLHVTKNLYRITFSDSYKNVYDRSATKENVFHRSAAKENVFSRSTVIRSSIKLAIRVAHVTLSKCMEIIKSIT